MEVIINDVTMSAYMYIDVAAGKKANGTLEIYTDSLKAAGIEEIATINVADAYIFDTDSYETIVEIPFYVVTSLGEGYIQAIDDSGDTLLEEKGIVVKSKVISDEFYGKTVLLYVKNESEKDITIEGTNISVNGFMIDAWLYDTVYAGTVRFCELDLFASSLEENGIEEVEDVTFTINIIDPKSYNTIANSGELQVLVNG